MGDNGVTYFLSDTAATVVWCFQHLTVLSLVLWPQLSAGQLCTFYSVITYLIIQANGIVDVLLCYMPSLWSCCLHGLLSYKVRGHFQTQVIFVPCC